MFKVPFPSCDTKMRQKRPKSPPIGKFNKRLKLLTADREQSAQMYVDHYMKEMNNGVIRYKEYPHDASEEYKALRNPKIMIHMDSTNLNPSISQIRDRPLVKITDFTLYDGNRCLCPFEPDIFKQGVKIRMSGYLKPISDTDESSLYVKDIGPISESFIHDFENGSKLCIILTTEIGEYKLISPSVEYTHLMNDFYEKTWVVNSVAKFIKLSYCQAPTYIQLLENLTFCSMPDLQDQTISKEMLRKHAHYVYNQVEAMEEEYDKPFTELACIKQLRKKLNMKPKSKKIPRINIQIKETVNKMAITNASTTPIAGNILENLRKNLNKIPTSKNGPRINIQKKVMVNKMAINNAATTPYEGNILENLRKNLNKIPTSKNGPRINIQKKVMVNKMAINNAATTPYEGNIFKKIFKNHLDTNRNNNPIIEEWEGCECCQLRNCGQCDACQAIIFSGLGNNKNVNELGDDFDEKVLNANLLHPEDKMPKKKKRDDSKKIEWISSPVKVDKQRLFFETVQIDGTIFKVGDYVIVDTEKSNISPLVARLMYMYKNIKEKKECFHSQIFIRAADTVLGEIGDPTEVFLTDRCCDDVPLTSILRKACVERCIQPKDWYKLGVKAIHKKIVVNDGNAFVLKKFYSKVTARFEDLPIDPKCSNLSRSHRYCPSCERKMIILAKEIPRVFDRTVNSIISVGLRTEYDYVRWQDKDYKKGCGVFLTPESFQFENNINHGNCNKENDFTEVNENMYPEKYRMSNNNLHGSNIKTQNPFCVGYITAVIVACDGQLVLPKDIYLRVNMLYRPENTTSKFPHNEDVNVLYWSNEIKEVPFFNVEGLCQLTYVANIPQQGTIYEWLEADPSRMYFQQSFERTTGRFGEVPQQARHVGSEYRAKEDGTGKNSNGILEPDLDKVNVRPLRTLDVFSGCGGLADGLHRSGVADCKWAIENDKAAAATYSLNNKECTVFEEDCNALLKDLLSGATHSARGLLLPRQGEVELLCGGPPCQGISGMNRSNFSYKNSLVATYLSFCDYYRPKYFILENVRNFVTFKKGMMLKHTLRALLDMGYQCTFGLLQAGNFGVPKTRRRLIILAVAPGCVLPLYPESTHVFNRCACSLTVKLDGKRFFTNSQWFVSAPRRTCTIYDAVSNLPPIKNDVGGETMKYDSMAMTHFQHLVRDDKENVKLQWAMDEYFSTTVTDLEPLLKQRRVLHPDQNRVVTTRECARSQGFRESYRFAGSLQDLYRQVENAVPPPLAMALGREIKKALETNNTKKHISSTKK